MKKLVLSLVAVSLATLTPTLSVPAVAQTSIAHCEAKSPSAIGWASAYAMADACDRALYECSIRTPYYQTCYVTRQWWN